MKFTNAPRSALIVSIALVAGACGSSSSDNGLASSAESPTSTTVAEGASTSSTEVPTTTADETSTTVEGAETTIAPADRGGLDPFAGMTDDERAAALSQMDLTEEQLTQFEMLLESPIAREAMAQGFVESTDLTIEQATCLIENGDIIGLMIGVTGAMTEPNSDVTASFLRTLDTCDIPLSAFGG